MSQDFFTNSIGNEVIRITPNGLEYPIIIKDYEAAKFLHETQDYGYSYRARIAAVSSNVCIACEG